MYNRLISLDKNPKRSFFLWGPRQSGKSTLLKALYPQAKYIDLLQSDVFATYVRRHSLLRDLETDASLIIIDEVQKIPALLDEVHWCIENEKRIFALSGSSARKLKRDHANLLAAEPFASSYMVYPPMKSDLVWILCACSTTVMSQTTMIVVHRS